MLDAFLLPANTVVTAKGDSEALDISGAASRIFLLTLTVDSVVEQEAIDVFVYTSADGAAWEAKAVAGMEQKFYVGEYPLLVDLSDKARGEVCSRALGCVSLGPRRDGRAIRDWCAIERGVAGSVVGR